MGPGKRRRMTLPGVHQLPGEPAAANRWPVARLPRLAIGLCLSLALGPARADCTPDDQVLDLPGPHLEAQLRDPALPRAWRSAVRRQRGADGLVRYQVRPVGRAPPRDEAWYETVEPVGLGGRSLGFLLRRGGCQWLRDARAEALPLPAFKNLSTVNPAGRAEGAARVVLVLDDDEQRLYAAFVDGRLQATSPRAYARRSPANSLALWGPDHLRAESVGSEAGFGVLDLRTLQEVLAPRWAGVGVLEFDAGRHYLVADDGRSHTVFSADGSRRLLEGLGRLKVMRGGWFRGGGPDSTMLAAWTGADRCRIFDGDLKPVLPWPLPATHDQCPSWQVDLGGPQLLAEGPDGRTHVFSKLSPTGAREVAVVDGVPFGISGTGYLVTRLPSGEGARYRVWSAAGEPLNGRDFEGARRAGCNGFEVLDAGSWKQLDGHGRVSERRSYPFSC